MPKQLTVKEAKATLLFSLGLESTSAIGHRKRKKEKKECKSFIIEKRGTCVAFLGFARDEDELR